MSTELPNNHRKFSKTTCEGVIYLLPPCTMPASHHHRIFAEILPTDRCPRVGAAAATRLNFQRSPYAILRLHVDHVQCNSRRGEMSQLRVFLSHSSQDKAAADQFARAF